MYHEYKSGPKDLELFSCRASLQVHLSKAWEYLIIPIGVLYIPLNTNSSLFHMRNV